MQLHLGCIADDFFFFLKKVEVQEREGLVHLVRISIKGSVGETHPRELKKKWGNKRLKDILRQPITLLYFVSSELNCVHHKNT